MSTYGEEGSELGRNEVRVAGSSLGDQWHVCGFFDGAEALYRALLPFIRDGFEHGDKAVHIVDPRLRDDHLKHLVNAGIDPDLMTHSEQLEVLDWSQVHLRGGAFDQDQTLDLIRAIREKSTSQGFSRIRYVTQMEWALEDRSGVEALLEYEAKANLYASPDPVVCAYDLRRFSASVVVEVIRTHPMVILGNMLVKNPFFVPPEQFLDELRQRRRL